MHSNLPLPKLLEIISRIVNDSGCTVRIVDEIPVQDREIRELCLQIYELRRPRNPSRTGNWESISKTAAVWLRI